MTDTPAGNPLFTWENWKNITIFPKNMKLRLEWQI